MTDTDLRDALDPLLDVVRGINHDLTDVAAALEEERVKILVLEIIVGVLLQGAPAEQREKVDGLMTRFEDKLRGMAGRAPEAKDQARFLRSAAIASDLGRMARGR